MLQSSDSDMLNDRRYALCIGIGTYTNLSNRNLRYAVDDAAAIAERLVDPRRGSFVVTTLTEPTQTTKEAIEDAVKELLSAPDRQTDDLALLYFSCHGDVNKKDNTFCLLTSDATSQQDRIYKQKTVIDISDLARWFSNAKTHHIIMLLDVCHSGGAGVALQHFKLNLDAGPNFFIIGAVRQDKTTTENSSLRHGMFTHCLLRAFEQAPTKDGWLTVTQIQNFVSDEISWFAKDHPIQIQVSSVFVNPHLPLLRNPGYPEHSLLPPLWNVPLSRNSFFTGQDDLLSQLASMLQSEQKTALTQPHALNGLGGIGKTQLALEYAYRHRQDYHAVLWGRADTREVLYSTFANIASLLDLPEKDEKDQRVIVKAVKEWLNDRSQWLFILDNADNLELIKDFIPQTFRGNLLLTTRAQTLGELAQNLEVKLMQPENAALLLLRRSGLIARDASLEAASPSNIAQAKEITKELGELPLAIDQAGAYIAETGCTLSEYQSLYRSIHKKDLLNERGKLVGDHPKPVATTWSLSFQKVKERNLAAADLLQFCAYLNPDAIPIEILTEGAEYVGPYLQSVASDPFNLNQAIAVLRDYSLIQRNREERTLSIHRLVQAVLKESMSEQTQHEWAKRTVQAVNRAFPDVTDVKLWEQCERYFPHALECERLTETYNFEFAEVTNLLNNMALYLCNRYNQYSQAEPLLKRALEISERCLGPEHPDMITQLLTLAQLYERQDRYEEAELLLKRALEISERCLGPEHPTTARNLSYLGDIYISRYRYEEAELLLKRALEISERHLGLEHPDMVYQLLTLGRFYERQDRGEEAELLLKRALETSERHLGPNYPATFQSLCNLGAFYIDQRRYEEAEPLLKRALEISERHLGLEHPDMAESLENTSRLLGALAQLYARQGRYEEAEPLLKRALEISGRHLGWGYPATARSLCNLGAFYISQARGEEAEPLLKRALEISERHLGPMHLATFRSLYNLGAFYIDQRRYEEAEPLLKRALEISERHLGPMYLITRDLLLALARLYDKQGRHKEAELLLFLGSIDEFYRNS